MRLLSVLLPAVLLGCVGSEPAPAPQTDAEPRILDVPVEESRLIGERDYLLYIPSGVDLTPATPVLLNFHGSTPTFVGAVDTHARITEATDHAQAHGYVVALPHARVLDERQAWDSGPDSEDYDFVAAILDAVDEEVGIDRQRVFASGYSSGGFLSFGLACHRPELVTAVASVAGSIRDITDCPGAGDTPALFIHGTLDERVDYTATTEAAADWRSRAGCVDDAVVTLDSGDALCERWEDCQVEFCTIDEGGHTWPGTQGSQLLLTTVGEGKTSTALSANDHIWDAFNAP